MKDRDSACCCKSLIINPMHSLPLADKGLGRRMGRDKSEDLPMTLGPWFLQDYKAGDFEGVILIIQCNFVEGQGHSAMLN